MQTIRGINRHWQRAATRCNTLQHAATRCNTLQHTATDTHLHKTGLHLAKEVHISTKEPFVSAA